MGALVTPSIDRVDVIATTISGSVKDWRKIPRLKPLFEAEFPGRVRVHLAGSHEEARTKARDAVREGSLCLVSAGGAGTFNRVTQGILDAGGNLSALRLAFLRKGSADLIGKALHVPDQIEEAVRVIARGFREDRVVPCDVVNVREEGAPFGERNFMGFGGIGVIGDIPHYTENPLTKYYKGFLGWMFGDLGPFRVGTGLALLESVVKRVLGRGREFDVFIDGNQIPDRRHVFLLLIGGDLGADMPFGRGLGLGKGTFHAVLLKDKGLARLPGQLSRSFDGRLMENPDRWGLDMRPVTRELRVVPRNRTSEPYRVNIDGLKWSTVHPVTFSLRGRLCLISGA